MTRCLAPTCNDGPPPLDGDTDARPRLTEDPWNLCARCFQRLEHNLADLPALDDAVRALVPHGLSPGLRLGNSPTKGSPPLPVRGLDTLLDHLTDTQAVLVSWVQLVCEETSLHGPAVSDSPTLARWLLARLDWLGQHPAAGDLTDEVGKLHRTGTALAGVRQHRNATSLPCRDCGAHELYRLDGDDHHLCGACGLTFHQAEYDKHRADIVAALTVTAVEGAFLADVEAATFRQWVSRGHVRRVGTDDPARYYREDVTAMVDAKEGAA